ncbi:unnamed protein product [Sphagnum jensenii]
MCLDQDQKEHKDVNKTLVWHLFCAAYPRTYLAWLRSKNEAYCHKLAAAAWTRISFERLPKNKSRALEIMSVMEEDKGRNVNFRRGRVKKICSWQLVVMLLKTPRLQCTALTAENEVGLSLGFCCVAVIAGWDDEALLLCLESPL